MKEAHLPDHSSQKGKKSLHDRKFSHAYLLLDVRLIPLYTLQDNHSCWRSSEIKFSPGSGYYLNTRTEYKASVWPSKTLPIQQHQTWTGESGNWENNVYNSWINSNRLKYLNVKFLTLCCCLRRSRMLPHWPSPCLGGSPSEPSPQLWKLDI